jgi:hypothetical protein
MFISTLLMAMTLTFSPVSTTLSTQQRSTALSTQQRSWNTTTSVWAHYPAWVHRFGLCVARHESWTAGLWKAQNPVSSASGAFQYLDSTWRGQARRAHVGTQYRRAKNAPAVIQVRVFAYNVYHYHAQRSWYGTHCGYGT